MKQYILIIASVVTLSVLSVVNVKAQDFRANSSAMMTTGSQYASPVNAVGAEAVSDLATTTYDQSSSSSRANIRRIGGMGAGDDPGSAAEGSPIGAPLIPLILFATAYAVVKRK